MGSLPASSLLSTDTFLVTRGAFNEKTGQLLYKNIYIYICAATHLPLGFPVNPECRVSFSLVVNGYSTIEIDVALPVYPGWGSGSKRLV